YPSGRIPDGQFEDLFRQWDRRGLTGSEGVPRPDLLTVHHDVHLADRMITLDKAVEHHPKMLASPTSQALEAAFRPRPVRPPVRNPAVQVLPSDHCAETAVNQLHRPLGRGGTSRIHDQPLVPFGDEIQIELPDRGPLTAGSPARRGDSAALRERSSL